MANKAHLARLQQGVWAWNEWLDQHPQIRPNLTGADLRGTDLSMMDLSAAYLSRADLSRADLAGAHLAGADLTEAHLRGAHLSRVERIRAHLAEADLGGADLTEAHLAGVDLTRVDLTRGDLSGTDFPGAPSPSTGFGNVDLSTVRGLDTLEPCGPSTIGIDTLERSHGNLPEVFLWGAGVPEDFLTSIRSLVRRAFEFYACVISYNHTDQPFARRLHDPWQGRGIRGWLDEPQMRPGEDISAEIDRGLRFWDQVLRCCSQASLTRWWVDHAITKAFETERRLMTTRETKVRALIPLTLDGFLCTWMRGNAAEVKARIAADCTGGKRSHPPFDRAFTRVIQARRAEEGGRAPRPTSKR